MSEDFPKLRDLETLPLEQDGQQLILLHDPAQIGKASMAVSPEVYLVLSLFNGKNSILDIQAELTRLSGRLIYREQIDELIGKLNQAYFLDNQEFERRREELAASYRAEEIRPAHHAGASYPADASDLSRFLDSLFADAGGAGAPGPRRADSQVSALIAPHIDLRLGGPVYTHAYRRLAESEPPDLFLILGTGHQRLPQLFSVSRKDFSTPLGCVRADRDYLALLDEVWETPLFPEDMSHRTEHTIEFQLIFLQHLFDTAPFHIVPVLSSFSFQELNGTSKTSPPDDFRRFVDAVLEASSRIGKRICYLASVDFAHIGPRYGDGFKPDVARVHNVMERDREMIEPILAGDAGGFVDYVSREQDRRRICGFPCISTLLQLISGARGELLAHSHCTIDSMGSFVTYASIAFSDPPPNHGEPEKPPASAAEE